MKTHKYILLLWLLVLAGSFEGWGQTDSLSSSLTDQEVIKLRSELVEAFKNDSIEKAVQLRAMLWDARPNPLEYLSAKEFYLILFLQGDYNEILSLYPERLKLTGDVTRFPDIGQELKTEALEKTPVIFDRINEDFDLSDQLTLNELLFKLLSSSVYNDTAQRTANNFKHDLYGVSLASKHAGNEGAHQSASKHDKAMELYRKADNMIMLFNVSIGIAGGSGLVALGCFLAADIKYNKYQDATTEADKLRSQVERYDQIATISATIMVASLTASLCFLIAESDYSSRATQRIALFSDQNKLGILVRL